MKALLTSLIAAMKAWLNPSPGDKQLICAKAVICDRLDSPGRRHR
jgi:hypothetical protein